MKRRDGWVESRRGLLSKVGSLGFGLALMLGSGAVWAQEVHGEKSADAQASKEEAPPDVVILNNGGMVRGLISELDPDGDVVIKPVSGKLKTFAMVDVRYAGTRAGVPLGEPKQVAVERSGKPKAKPKKKGPARKVAGSDRDEKVALLQLSATEADITFQLRDTSANYQGMATGISGQGLSTMGVAGTVQGYSVMCIAPCERKVAKGQHRFALSKKGGAPVEVEEPIAINGPSNLQGTYTSRQSLRVAGWVITGLSVAGGTVWSMSISGSEDGVDETSFYGGLGVTAAGLAIGLILAFQKDKAEITVTPLTKESAERRSWRLRANAAPRLSPRGLLF